MPEGTLLRVEQQKRRASTGDLLLGQVAERLQNLAERATGGDHLQNASMTLVGQFSQLPVMHLLDGAIPAYDGAGVVALSPGPGANPAVAAIGHPDPVFALIGLAGR
jgi:hypothetical protein